MITAEARPRRGRFRRRPGWGDVPHTALEHPFTRLLQAVAVAAAVAFAVTRLPLLPEPQTVEPDLLAAEEAPATAAAVGRSAYPSGTETALIVSTEAIVDGVAASALAGALDAPILLSQPDAITPATREALRDLRVRRVILIGGTGALRPAVGDGVTRAGVSVERLEGANRFETAARLAVAAAEQREPLLDGVRTALLASGEQLADALAAGGLAAAQDAPLPVLLTHPDRVPGPTRQALSDLRIQQVLIIGGSAVVGEQVAAALDGLRVQRLAGLSRFATAVDIADFATGAKPFSPTRAVVVPAGDDLRALAAAPLAGEASGVLLLAESPTALGADAEGWLERSCSPLTDAYVVATPDAEPLLGDVAALLADCG